MAVVRSHRDVCRSSGPQEKLSCPAPGGFTRSPNEPNACRCSNALRRPRRPESRKRTRHPAARAEILQNKPNLTPAAFAERTQLTSLVGIPRRRAIPRCCNLQNEPNLLPVAPGVCRTNPTGFARRVPPALAPLRDRRICKTNPICLPWLWAFAERTQHLAARADKSAKANRSQSVRHCRTKQRSSLPGIPLPRTPLRDRRIAKRTQSAPNPRTLPNEPNQHPIASEREQDHYSAASRCCRPDSIIL
jgi:hypothetical protein